MDTSEFLIPAATLDRMARTWLNDVKRTHLPSGYRQALQLWLQHATHQGMSPEEATYLQACLDHLLTPVSEKPEGVEQWEWELGKTNTEQRICFYCGGPYYPGEGDRGYCPSCHASH